MSTLLLVDDVPELKRFDRLQLVFFDISVDYQFIVEFETVIEFIDIGVDESLLPSVEIVFPQRFVSYVRPCEREMLRSRYAMVFPVDMYSGSSLQITSILALPENCGYPHLKVIRTF